MACPHDRMFSSRGLKQPRLHSCELCSTSMSKLKTFCVSPSTSFFLKPVVLKRITGSVWDGAIKFHSWGFRTVGIKNVFRRVKIFHTAASFHQFMLSKVIRSKSLGIPNYCGKKYDEIVQLRPVRISLAILQVKNMVFKLTEKLSMP